MHLLFRSLPRLAAAAFLGVGNLVAQDAGQPPPWSRMDYGPALHWTYQVAEDNIAYKGIAVRLDEDVDGDKGGVAHGSAWLLYDHDTMRVAAAWTGSGFIDWKGVAFDGSHNSHASIVGDVAFVNPVGPGWGQPGTGSFEDPRFLGRDHKPYGPLPRAWAQYRGRHVHGSRVALEYTVGDALVLETPGLEAPTPEFRTVSPAAPANRAAAPVFSRSIAVGASTQDLVLRVAPDALAAALVPTGAPAAAVRLAKENGFWTLAIPAAATPVQCKVVFGAVAQGVAEDLARRALRDDPRALLGGGAAQWNQPVVTRASLGTAERPEDAFAIDEIRAPDGDANPWHSWLRFGGFDFASADRALLGTWNGDVWTVDGVDGGGRGDRGDGELGELRWTRIAAGLFQPLGVVVVDGTPYVGCRDQIVALEDRNGDGETDFYRCFNSDHQVTEHFHEFAMGLQVDGDGNFYYAKSARHAKDALVPHHGTLLRVSADGQRTDIVANGFRAANGVCVNGDGSFFVTDQEGHWTPKNRINRVVEGGFYGNMMGFHDRESSADEDMEPPLLWITNEFDRSPGELLWVPPARADKAGGWNSLAGGLLQLSYGVGRVFLVLQDDVDGVRQGAMVALPLEAFPTGVMRGRFHPTNGQLYACGLFGWSGARTRPGGFFRVRDTGQPLRMPVAMHTVPGGLELTFGDDLDPETAQDPGSYAIKTWSLRRSRNYGSDHHDEAELDVEVATLAADGRTVRLAIPALAATMGLEVKCNLDTADGVELRATIHGTLHAVRAR